MIDALLALMAGQSPLGISGPVIAVGTILVLGVFVWKTGSNRAWRDAAEGWKARAEELDASVAEKNDVIQEQAVTIQKLEALPNLERLVKLMADTAQHQEKGAARLVEEAVGRIAALVEAHERRAEERHAALLKRMERAA